MSRAVSNLSRDASEGREDGNESRALLELAVDALHHIGGSDVPQTLRRAIDDGEALLDILGV